MADDIVKMLRDDEHNNPCTMQALLSGYAADEIERLRAHIEHLVSTHPLAAEYEAQTADPSAWMTDREARRG